MVSAFLLWTLLIEPAHNRPIIVVQRHMTIAQCADKARFLARLHHRDEIVCKPEK